MYSNITQLYNEADRNTNAVRSNKFQVKYFDRRLENDNYVNKSVNNMNKLPYSNYLANPTCDNKVLHEMQKVGYSIPKVEPVKKTSELKPDLVETKEPFMKITKEVGLFPLSSPEVFGPPFWFVLHNGSAAYPDDPSPDTQERMKNFILALPIMIRCLECREHATAHIEKNKDKLTEITSSKKNLFSFFVDFHNMVNKFTNKPQITYEQAMDMYTGKAEVEIIKVQQ